MDENFWHERWQSGRIGFHNDAVHPLLVSQWGRLGVAPGPVFVPLCGKSRDMVWLADRGHPVVGCDLSEIAARQFFEERDLAPAVESRGDFVNYSAGPFEIIVGDYFRLGAAAIDRCVAVYDRAALIALPAGRRQAYVDQLDRLIGAGCPLLLITLEHDNDALAGPPFAVDRAQVQRLFRGWQPAQVLDGIPSTVRGHPVNEIAYRIDP